MLREGEVVSPGHPAVWIMLNGLNRLNMHIHTHICAPVYVCTNTNNNKHEIMNLGVTEKLG